MSNHVPDPTFSSGTSRAEAASRAIVIAVINNVRPHYTATTSRKRGINILVQSLCWAALAAGAGYLDYGRFDILLWHFRQHLWVYVGFDVVAMGALSAFVLVVYGLLLLKIYTLMRPRSGKPDVHAPT